MNNKRDKFIKRKELCEYIHMGDTKLKEMIKKNLFIKPIPIEGFNEEFFSLNELDKWMEEQKQKRNI